MAWGRLFVRQLQESVRGRTAPSRVLLRGIGATPLSRSCPLVAPALPTLLLTLDYFRFFRLDFPLFTRGKVVMLMGI